MSIEEERLIERVQPEVSLCEEPPVEQPQEPASVRNVLNFWRSTTIRIFLMSTFSRFSLSPNLCKCMVSKMSHQLAWNLRSRKSIFLWYVNSSLLLQYGLSGCVQQMSIYLLTPKHPTGCQWHRSHKLSISYKPRLTGFIVKEERLATSP